MEYGNLNLTLVSATVLKKSRFTGKSNVYAVAFISEATGKHQKQRISTNKTGDAEPTWNFPMEFIIDEVSGMTLVVKIKTEGMFGGKNLGEVHVPVKELLEGFKGNGKTAKTVSYQVLRRPSGKPNGVLSFKYEFGEKFTTPLGTGENPAGFGYQNQHPESVYCPRRLRPGVPPCRCSSMGFGFGNSSMGFGFGTGLVRGALVNR
ncbi:protein SRC2 homolog [Bidens hawaiensis]|uniref:protein SRC2 homolog n=1 Tax=Bidens hawaiensis TaxID=980011 RepID=UPI0040499857